MRMSNAMLGAEKAPASLSGISHLHNRVTMPLGVRGIVVGIATEMQRGIAAATARPDHVILLDGPPIDVGAPGRRAAKHRRARRHAEHERERTRIEAFDPGTVGV